MIIVLNRFDQDQWGTLGEATLPGFRCYMVEKQETGEHCRIPAGYYHVGMRKIGHSKFDQMLGVLLGTLYSGTIEIQSVPGRTDIEIHPANSAVDLEGCFGPGNKWKLDPAGSGGLKPTFFVENSRATYSKLYPLVKKAVQKEGCTMHITENFLVKPKPPVTEGVPVA